MYNNKLSMSLDELISQEKKDKPFKKNQRFGGPRRTS